MEEKKQLLFGSPDWNRFRAYSSGRGRQAQEVIEDMIKEFLEDSDAFEAWYEANRGQIADTSRKRVLLDKEVYESYIEAADKKGAGNRQTLISELIPWFLDKKEKEEEKEEEEEDLVSK